MSTWSTSLSGYAPDDAISAVVEDCKDLVEEKGEGKIRRILHEAFASLRVMRRMPVMLLQCATPL